MRVGIITIHFVPNYGAMLQAYGLSAYLRSTGVDASVIDYRQPALANYFRLKWRFPPPLKHWLRVKRSAAFVSRHLPLSSSSYSTVQEFEKDLGEYDAFITGSDQVWFTGPVQYFDPMYFLEFQAPNKKKISYAASAGGTTDFAEYKQRAGDALKAYDHLSVRDAHTASLVEPLIGRPPVQVVDPVFLTDFSELSGKPPLSEPYLLVFGDFNGKLSDALEAVIRAAGLRTVVSLQYPNKHATHRVASPDPAEWLAYFRHASFVLTSYFHGTAIAVKFQRPFLAIPTPGRRIKVATLLEGVGLAERCILDEPETQECEVKVKTPIAWDEPQKLLNQKIDASRNFLKTALT